MGIIGDNICEMIYFAKSQSIHTNIGIQVNTTAVEEA